MRKDIQGLYRTTAISAIITALVYLVLFYFVDRAVDLWIHNNYSDTWLPLLGTYISYMADGSFVRFGIALCFILFLISDSGEKR